MSIKDLIIRKNRNETPARRFEDNSLFSFQRDMNNLFDNFFRGFELAPFEGLKGPAVASFNPNINVSETEKEVHISAELPGMDEKDISVEVDKDTLTIKGEKKEEHEEKGKNWHRVEQSYGSFHRTILLPAKVDINKAKAKFKKGILSVTIQKTEDEQKKKKAVEITTE
ncbi:MAG: Hsp20/alpha crystallin family protein [Kiritimatiellae bacterium]|nr:Hsp20/alpha crystallin family protein [Kiritimatiellia bacterium]MDD5520092.1 Hsp20/alpha crystallin family protein [Kiritimatiellia bacterium]